MHSIGAKILIERRLEIGRKKYDRKNSSRKHKKNKCRVK
jgi:hypothetical protein